MKKTLLLILACSFFVYGQERMITLFERTGLADNPSFLLKQPVYAGCPHEKVIMTPLNRLAKQDKLKFQLLDRQEYVATVQAVCRNINSTWTLVAKLDDFHYSYLIVSQTGDNVTANIDIPEHGKKYLLIGNKEHGDYLLDVSGRQLEVENLPERLATAGQPWHFIEDYRRQADEDQQRDTVIDIMVLYTPAAKTWADSNGGIANVIANAVTLGNTSLANSSTSMQLNLVHSAEVSYTESGSSNTDLDRLTNTSDTYIDEIHTWRNTYKADIVTMFTFIEDTGGLGWLLGYKSGQPQYAFSICRVQQVGWTYTMVHELGHNMGAHHHKQQTVQPGPTNWGSSWSENTWSAGWKWTTAASERYCCLMSYTSGYPDGQTYTRVAHFSNPSVTYGGYPTGDAADGDNARTLREMRLTLASYRVADKPTITTQPTSQTKNQGQSVTFTIVATGTAPIGYQWKKGGTNITDATADSYTISSVTASNAGSYTCYVSNVAGDATSDAATLTVIVPPEITTHPTSQTKNQGQSVTFTITATGTAPNYQWKKGGANITDATADSYTIASVTANDAGSYTCYVSNAAGNETSNAATLTIIVPPTITTHPASQSKYLSESVTFTIVATGTTPNYQWKKEGTDIPDATADSYTIASVIESDAGNYVCYVSNAAGDATSDTALLTVYNSTPPAPPKSKKKGKSCGAIGIEFLLLFAILRLWRNMSGRRRNKL